MVKQFNAPSTSGEEGGSTILDRLMDMIGGVFASLRLAVLNDTLVAVKIGTTDTVVFHSLGFAPRSWEVVDRDANSVVWRSATENMRSKQTIILVASAPVNVTIRFN